MYHTVCRRVGDKIIIGKSLPAFIHNGGTYFLAQVVVYQDGQIDCWGFVTFEEFEQKVRSGWVVTNLPEDAEVDIHHLATFKARDVFNFVEEVDLVREVKDLLEQFKGELSLSEKCSRAFLRYIQNPTESNRAELRQAYLAVPKHLRAYILGDQDVKDTPIQTILEQNINEENLRWMRERYSHMMAT
jgi:hypothetical protein